MHSPKRLKITDVNPHLICVLCGGYYIDATTVIECLHSFCKSCIVKYLETNKYCPICDVQIHKSTPLLSIRPDQTLQNIVYKLVPSLFKNEMQRRVEFYEKHPEAIPALPEQRGEVTENTPIYFPDELLIVCLEYHDNQATHQMKRYLHCPASLPMSHLVKLIRGKFNLNAKHRVNIFFKDDLIKENVTLMDIAYTYQCRRKTPIHLTYKILEFRRKTIRLINYEPQKEVKDEKQPENEWKEVQLQISENGVMSVRNMESGESSPIPAVEAPPVISQSMVSSMNCINYPSSSTPPRVVSQSSRTASVNQSPALAHPFCNQDSAKSDKSIAEPSTPTEVISCSKNEKPCSVNSSSAESVVTSLTSNDVSVTSSMPKLVNMSTATISTNSVSSFPINSVSTLPTTSTNSVSLFPSNSLSILSAMSTASFPTNPAPTYLVNSVSTVPTISTSSVPINSLPSSSVSITTSSAVPSPQSAAMSSPRTGSPLQSTLSLKRTRSPFQKSSSPLRQNSSPAPSQAGSSPLHRSAPSPHLPSLIHSSVPISQQLPSPLPASSPSLYSPSFQTSSAYSKPSSPLMSSLAVSSSQMSPLVSMSKSITSLSASIVTPAMSLPLSSSAPLPPSTSSILPSITTHSVPMLPSPLNIASPPVSLAGYPSPSLPTSPSIISPHAILGNNMPHSPQGTVTTVAGIKTSSSIVPTSYPIMSTCRTQSEPIVSVSKVSKDQVRKPNNSLQVNKLSISRVPPGGMKEKSENLNKIVNKLSPNERVIGNTSVTIRPVTNSPNPPKLYQLPKSPIVQSPPTPINKEKPQPKYRSLKSPTKQWNPSVDRNSMLMKQSNDQSKSSRFFKMRNMPRFLGNPSSGVKPLYACPEEPPSNSNQNKQKLMLKIDPKTIPTSSISRSPTKQPPPYTPGSPKLSKPPPTYSDPKPFMNSRMPSPAHAGTFLPPNPYHLLYSGYPGFSHEANRMLSPELIRSMCAYHPSLNPSIGMLFNPIHSLPPRPQENFKPDPTPSVQRIPPTKQDSTSPKPSAIPSPKPAATPSPKPAASPSPKPAATASPKPAEEKRFPSPLDVSEPKKSTPPPPPTPMEVDKLTPAVQETPPKVNSTSAPSPPPAEPSSQNSTSDANETKVSLATKDDPKPNAEDNSVIKLNCDDINLNNNNNNNNSKESPPSQPSENVANKSQ